MAPSAPHRVCRVPTASSTCDLSASTSGRLLLSLRPPRGCNWGNSDQHSLVGLSDSCDIYGSEYTRPSLSPVATWRYDDTSTRRHDSTRSAPLRSGPVCFLPLECRAGLFLRPSSDSLLRWHVDADGLRVDRCLVALLSSGLGHTALSAEPEHLHSDPNMALRRARTFCLPINRRFVCMCLTLSVCVSPRLNLIIACPSVVACCQLAVLMVRLVLVVLVADVFFVFYTLCTPPVGWIDLRPNQAD
ncbi:unnamed protein product [Protopolystoma xenopodis]|uniref:Uncharacterized protein n=1 Tax=Protopolystoma xenopodis TaxID=117903 RepID=A0A448WYA6_9PLAT|nr:unnamed protein product [Protopolystoma xenopodis]